VNADGDLSVLAEKLIVQSEFGIDIYNVVPADYSAHADVPLTYRLNAQFMDHIQPAEYSAVNVDPMTTCSIPVVSSERTSSSASLLNFDLASTCSTTGLNHASPTGSAVECHKRRRMQRHLWKCNVRKRNRDRGMKYTSRKGKEVAAKIFCDSEHQCAKKCVDCSSVTPEDRKHAFSHFWAIGDFDLQQAFICGSVVEQPALTTTTRRVPPVSDSMPSPPGSPTTSADRVGTPLSLDRRVQSSTSSSTKVTSKRHYKNFTRIFSLQTPSGSRIVCKEMFLQTLQISCEIG